jgi:hypothetical protein
MCDIRSAASCCYLGFRGQPFSPLRNVLLLIMLLSGVSASSAGAEDNDLTCSTPVSTVPAAATSASSSSATTGASTSDAGKITTDPSQLDLKLFSEGQSAVLSIRNDTASEIGAINISSLGLLDGKTGRPLPFSARIDKDKTSLKPHERTDCTFHLHSLSFAGLYTGTLRVQAGGRETLVPITLRMRGPWLPVWNGFPLTILTGVFLGGWCVSLLLDNWYTNRLPRVQQVLLLREEQAAMSNFLTQLASWEDKNKGATLPKTAAIVAFDRSDLGTTLTQANTISLLELQQNEARFALACHLNDELWTALQVAGAKVPKAAIPIIVAQIDSLARPTDTVQYRNSLLQILTSPLPAGAAIAVGQTAADTPGVDLTKISSSTLRGRVRVMDVVKSLVLAVLTWITAYSFYYYPNPSFGGVIDYLTVFVWAVGLTTTGSQLVSTIRKPTAG